MSPTSASIVLFCLCFVSFTFALDNGLARTPQMGWNSWNRYHCDIDEDLIKQTAQAIIKHGLKDAGYNYVNVDDCWAAERLKNGSIVPDSKTFPSGIKALADYVHSLGLKFGIYSSAGTMTCAKRPGTLYYETYDANSYASWGVDYFKYDNCYDEKIPPRIRYPIMRDALNATGRPILYSLCEWGVDNPATWAARVGNSWRTTGDIEDTWESMIRIIDMNDKVAEYAGPGGWNDPDMLEVGNGGMTSDEYRAHFSLWALSKAPLLIGTDVVNISHETLSILTNTEVIKVNQDPLGVQGKKVGIYNITSEVWAGPLQDGSVAVILFNRATTSASITAYWQTIGLGKSVGARVRDLWAHTDVGIFHESFSSVVAGHACRMLRITPQ